LTGFHTEAPPCRPSEKSEVNDPDHQPCSKHSREHLAITVEDPRLTPIVESCAEAGSQALVDTGIPQHVSDTAALGIDTYVAATLKSAEEAALQDERVRRAATDHVWVAARCP